jgi:hypothetical protein
VLGWAGWDHLGQARALATVYLDRRQQAGWPAQRLLPLLAGLVELEPWLRQWHADPQPGYAGSPADFFTGLIDTELAALGTDRATLATIRGVADLPRPRPSYGRRPQAAARCGAASFRRTPSRSGIRQPSQTCRWHKAPRGASTPTISRSST